MLGRLRPGKAIISPEAIIASVSARVSAPSRPRISDAIKKAAASASDASPSRNARPKALTSSGVSVLPSRLAATIWRGSIDVMRPFHPR